jgi:UDP-galactopyranose mutase
MSDVDLVVVGSGLFGLTVAERVAEGLGKRVLVLDRRDHLGGNAWSEVEPTTGIEVHRYGAHLFHTSNERVWEYVNRFTSFTGYQHRVFSVYKDRVYPLPINLATICEYVGRHLTPAQAREWVAGHAAEVAPARPATWRRRPSRSSGGRSTRRSCAATPPSSGRPTRATSRRRSSAGCRCATLRQPLLRRHPRGAAGRRLRRLADPDGRPPAHRGAAGDGLLRHRAAGGVPVVYTGPLDRYFDYRHGQLQWRTLDFEQEVLPQGDFQGTPVMNYADEDVPWTRIHEFRHFHPERDYPTTDRGGQGVLAQRRRRRRAVLPGQRRQRPRAAAALPGAGRGGARTSGSAAGSAPTSTSTCTWRSLQRSPWWTTRSARG